MLMDILTVVAALASLTALYLVAGRFEIEGALAQQSIQHEKTIRQLRRLLAEQERDMADLVQFLTTMRSLGQGEVLDRHL